MSFNDVSGRSVQTSTRSHVVTGGGPGGASIERRGSGINSNQSDLGNDFQLFQRICVTTREKLTEMRRRKVSVAEKNDIDSKIREIRQLETNLKNQLDQQFKALDSLPRTDVTAAQKRVTLGKLQKDFDRLKVGVAALSTEANLIKPTAATTSPGSSDPGGAGGGAPTREDGPGSINGTPILVQMSGREVDEAIMEERERDIKKINQDITLINEMFTDMAQLVEKQGDTVKKIGEDTDKAHEQAQAGLGQVQQAAQHQKACTIS